MLTKRKEGKKCERNKITAGGQAVLWGVHSKKKVIKQRKRNGPNTEPKSRANCWVMGDHAGSVQEMGRIKGNRFGSAYIRTVGQIFIHF